MITKEIIRILIVEGNETYKYLFREHLGNLKDFKAIVVEACNYDEGITLFNNEEIDLCFLAGQIEDLTMSHFIAQLNEASAQIPMVGLYKSEPSEIDFKRDEINDYLLYKNLSVQSLNSSIRHAIENNESVFLAKAHKERSKNLFYGSMEAIFTVDCDYNIIECNRSFMQLFKIEHCNDLKLQDLFGDSDAIEGIFKTPDDRKGRGIRKKRIRNSEGEEIIAYLSISPLETELDEAKFIGIIHDITELENAQSKLAETEKLAMIHRMARIIGHEVRNPLTNILLATEEIKELLGDNPEVDIMLQMIRRNSDRISTLIDNFLKNARTSEYVKKEVVLEDILENATSTCQDRIILKKINFILEGCKEKTVLFLDSDKVGIAFTNILINAIEALEYVEKPKLRVSVRSELDKAYVEIEDNGIGMSEETLKNLFNPFYSDKQGGLGLGMANARNIFNAHNTAVAVESTLNKGTKFTLSFPLEMVNYD